MEAAKARSAWHGQYGILRHPPQVLCGFQPGTEFGPVQLAQHPCRFGAHQAAQIFKTQIHGADSSPIGIRECKTALYKKLTTWPAHAARSVPFLR